MSGYAGYSDIFNPQTAMDRKGNVLEPVVGANYEAGIKGEFFGKRLNATAAIFRLEQTDLPADDKSFDNPTCLFRLVLHRARQGHFGKGDLSVNGALTPSWHVGAGYTYLKDEYATGENKGDRYDTWSPHHAFRLASTYRIPGSHWTVGDNLRLFTMATDPLASNKAAIPRWI